MINTLQGLYGTRSPLYITWSGTSVTSIQSVTFEVYIWTGAEGSRPASPHITISRTTGFGSNTTHTTDIATLIADQININIAKLFNDGVLSEQNGRVAWVQVDYDVDYNSGSNDTGSTDIFQVIDGYSYFTDGVNYSYSAGILSPTSEQNTYEYNVEMMPVYLGERGEDYDIIWGYKERVEADGGIVENERCANIGFNKFRVLLSDGSYHDYLFQESWYSLDEAEDRIKLFPSGVANLTNWLIGRGSALRPATAEWYKLQLLDTFENVLDERKFNVECEAKYTPIQLAYISKYGTWNYATFFKRSEETIDVTSQQYRTVTGFVKNNEWFVGLHNPVYKQYNKNGKRRLTINSGFVEEEFKEVMEQIMLSEYVLVVDSSTVVKSGSTYTYDINNNAKAVNVSTNSLVKKKSVNEKLIEYTLDVEYAFDELNTTL